ncbi:metallopeptidase [Anatilimnocola floriformis]|uniref:metallopeptidase n=1 Tax=Anatilimnocola floriformis TaxID=2948575 RepID=UPI0020C3D179|nr:metallopeptidase [Anatilimnocola floriformis]
MKLSCLTVLSLLFTTLVWSAHCAAAEKFAKTPAGTHRIEQIEGWTVHVDETFDKQEYAELKENTLRVVANQLYDIKTRVQPERVSDLQKIVIRLDVHNEKLVQAQYHPSLGWLKDNGHPAECEKVVHIPRAKYFLDRRHQSQQPFVLLHELAHAYHDQVLSFEHAGIKEAYERVKKAGLYDKALLVTGREVKHYALTNHKEFFAEMTECYLGTNDFFPFVSGELKKHDEETFRLLEGIWGKLP